MNYHFRGAAVRLTMGLLLSCCGEQTQIDDVRSSSAALDGVSTRSGQWVVYIGSHDSGNAGSATGQIVVAALNANDGSLTQTSAVARDDLNKLDHPTFLAVDRKHKRLFAVSENYFDPTPFQSSISSFSIAPGNGQLSFLSEQDTGFSFDPFGFSLGAVHLTIDGSGQHLLVAIFDTARGGGAVQRYPVAPDGTLGAMAQEIDVGVNPHQVLLDPQERRLLVPLKGSDAVAQLSYDASSGALSPAPVPQIATPAGAGPRHAAFSRDQRFMYLVSEDAATLSVYAYGNGTLTSTPLQSLSTLPNDAVAHDRHRAAEIAVAAGVDGLVYVSTRLDQRNADGSFAPLDGYVTAYRVNPNGTLRFVQATRVGREPRHFSLAPDGRFLVVANQFSDAVVAYRVLGDSGQLREVSRLTVSHPEYAGVVDLGG